jgi:hypothetical protein
MKEQQAGPSPDAQAHDAAGPHWSSHRAMYSRFVCAPDLVASAHPFGIYARGTTPDPPGSSIARRNSYAEALLDAADAHVAAAYKAGMWRELRGGGHGPAGCPLLRARKRRAGAGAEADMDGDGAYSMRKRKQRKGAFVVGGNVYQSLCLTNQTVSR